MKNWQITDLRWATIDDLKLPHWQNWNESNPLPSGFWQRIWEYPYATLHIPQAKNIIDVGGTYPFVLFPNWPDAISLDIRDLNKEDHALLKGKWPKGKLLISNATNIPRAANSFDYAMSISAIEEMPNTVKVLKEMIRVAKHRVVVTMDVSEELGVNRLLMRELEEFLGISLPPIPHNVLRSDDDRITSSGQSIVPEYKHIRVLGIVIDANESVKDVGILIPHWESYAFADACIKSLIKHQTKQIKQHIYLLDDNSNDGSYQKLKNKYQKNKSISFFQIKRADHNQVPNVGRVLDVGLTYVKEQYVAMLDADTVALSPEWISFPIKILDQYKCSSVGLDTGLSSAYRRLDQSKAGWWQPESGYSIQGGYYDNNWFTVTNNLYRVMRTATAKVVSQQIGFSRGPSINQNYLSLLKNWFVSKLGFNYHPQFNPRHPYLPYDCDNGVAANHFIDINRMGGKFNIPLTSYIGLTDKDGAFGQNISGLLFHFALSTRALSQKRREVTSPGKEYNSWVEQINKAGLISDSLLSQMVEKSKIFKKGGYDQSIPKEWYVIEYKYITKLLKKLRNNK